MELKSLGNYNKSFAALSVVLLSVTICLISTIMFLIIKHENRIDQLTESVWVVDIKSGIVSKGSLVLSKDNPGRYFEYKGHVELLYSLWFQFDQFSFTDNIKKAMFLLGNCGKIMRKDYTESDVLKRLQEKNMVVTVEIDSIKINMNSNPVHGYCFARQTSKNANGHTIRRMDSEFDFIDLVARSDKNKHGILIENLVITNKEKIE